MPMTRPTKTWLIALGVFAAYLLVAVILVFALKLHGPKMWQMVVTLAVLGLVSAGIFLWFMRDDLRTPVAGTPASGVDATLAAARTQLAAAKRSGKPSFGSLPVLLVIGPQSSTKTTTIVRSGLDPELLAGDVFRGDTVAPTSGINLWYSNDSVVVEAGGPLLKDAPAWHRLLRALRPRSLAAALTGRAQSPRLAVVCFSCDEFYKPGSGESVPAAAREIRNRLGEAAKHFGMRLPTYVVFTKLDTVPYFDAYTRNLSVDEAREPLGAALLPDSGGAGTYADRATPRIEQAFGELYASLAERRVQTLTREFGDEWKPGAYEFPREFNKLGPIAVDFLREIGRPSELSVSPVLRGFYFSGVQAVFVTENAAEQQVAAQRTAAPAVRSATAVFNAAAAMQAAKPAATGGTRKVPRWDFLPRLLREVVFGDAAAVRLTSAGARVGFWRRLGLGAVSTVAVLLAIAFIVSYRGNRRIQSASLDATRGIASLAPNPVDLPPADALQRLEALRVQLDSLSAYEHDGAPLGLRWGLYSGGQLYPTVRTAYFAAFNKLMFAGARANMLTALRALPDAPAATDDYGDTYSLLKAYIITTSHPEKSTPDFLAPVLMTRWLAGRSVDSARAQLARRQFVTYASELRYSNPFPDSADATVVAKARSFLRQFAGSESIYQFMLAEAAKANPSIQFNRKVAGAAPYVVDSYEVPGAFTKGGSVFMLGAFKTVDKFISGESWVVGEDAGNVDKAKLVADLSARYAQDYADQWRKFLQSASVARYSNVRDAAQKLAILSGNQSPLLALFSVVSQNTAVAIPSVTSAFQPVQLLTPPTATDKLIGDKNAPYMNALLTFQTSLDQTANAQGPAAEAAAGQASNNATAARTAARQIASEFTIDQQGHVQSTVQTLMEAPILYAEGLLKNFGAAEINVRARSFCAVARPLLAKFPFNPDATAQASIAEVTAMFKPGTGTLWRFYGEALANALPRQGNQFVPAGGSVKLSPGFVAFMNHAATFTDVMFKNDAAQPHVSFTVNPLPGDVFSTVAITVNGEVVRSSANGNIESAVIDWNGAPREAKLSAASGGAEFVIAGPFNGPWATFQLFYAADDWQPTQNGYRVGWGLSTQGQRVAASNGRGAKVVVQIDGAPAGLVLRRNAFSGSECSGDIAK